MVNDYIKCLQNVSNVFEVATIDAAVHCNKTLWTTNAEEKNGNWDKKGTQNCCHCHSDPAGHFWCPHLFSYSTNSLIWCCFCTGLWNSETPETVFDILRHSIFSIYLYLTTLEIGRPPWCFYSLPYNIHLYFSCLSLSFYWKHTLITSDLFLDKHCGLKKKFSMHLDLSINTEVITGAWLPQFAFYPFLFLLVKGWGSSLFFATKICMILGKPLCPNRAQVIPCFPPSKT